MYNPLPSFIYLKASEIHGYGLFTKVALLPSTEVGISHIYHDWFEDGWIRTPLGGFYNHSDSPNCELRSAIMDEGFRTDIRMLYTITDIKAGQELTCTYTLHLFNPPYTPSVTNNSVITIDL